MQRFLLVPVVILLAGAGCPAAPSDVQLRPEVPVWSEGSAPKVFRALVKDAQKRALNVKVQWERPALAGDPLATGSGTAHDVGNDVWEYTLGPESRPETLLRTQTVRYRWSVFTSDDAGASLLEQSLELSFQVACADHGECWLMAEQDRFIEAFDQLSVEDLAARGYIPSHGPRPFKGFGVTFFKGVTMFGEPSLLFYKPFPGRMELAGWGYASSFDLAQWPRKGCIPFESWFVHEQGWHTPDGGFLPSPPGTTIVPPPGSVWHGRLWDVHLWRREGTVPLVDIEDPTLLPDLLPGPDGAFVRVPWKLPS